MPLCIQSPVKSGGGGFFPDRRVVHDQQLDAAQRVSHRTPLEKGQLNDIRREMHKYKAYDSRRALLVESCSCESPSV